MATASSAFRPSMTVSIGVPQVHPSAEVLRIWSAPRLTRASRSRAARLAPSHRALPTYGPPTWLDTQARVMSASVSGRFSSWSKVMSSSRSTRPCTRRCHVSGGTWGRLSDVSTR